MRERLEAKLIVRDIDPEGENDIYLDHATTSYPKAEGVAEALARVTSTAYGSPHRGMHSAALMAGDILERARTHVGDFIGFQNFERIIFTPGATLSLNMALQGALCSGDHVITSCFSHNSILRPLVQLKKIGVGVTVVAHCDFGSQLLEAIKREIRPSTRWLVLPHASNVTGDLLPMMDICRMARRKNIRILLDASQSIGHVTLNLSELPVDIIAFGFHKALLGPSGIGCLVVAADDLLLKPMWYGGTGLQSEELEPDVIYPTSFEVGTQNLPTIAATSAALEYLQHGRYLRIAERSQQLYRDCLQRVQKIPRVKLLGECSSQSLPVISFNVEGMLPERTARLLMQQFQIMVRAGLHCAPLAHEAMGTYPLGAVRMSFGVGNTRKCVDRVCDALWQLSEASERKRV